MVTKVMLVATILVSMAAEASTLGSMMAHAYRNDLAYKEPTEAELDKAVNLFGSLFKTQHISAKDAASWKTLGFKIEQIDEGKSRYAVISEPDPDEGAGKGFYVIKLNSCSQSFLEAPHRPTDLYTYEILFSLLTEGDYAGAAINTIRRTKADLGKIVHSYFNAFTIAVAKNFKAPSLIQLHAFNSDKHTTDADMILSAATRAPAPYQSIKKCLEDKLLSSHRFMILQYPTDIEELGGTLNINEKNLHANNPQALFFHVEMGKNLRHHLKDNPKVRDAFSHCFSLGADSNSQL